MPKIASSVSTTLSESQKFSLTEKLKNEDQTVIADLYDLYGGVVYSIAIRIVKSSDVASTVLQDTFCKVWKYRANYDSSKSGLFTWITSIARNTAIDATRNQHFKSAANMLSLESAAHKTVNESNTYDGIGVPDLLKRMNEKHLTLLQKYYFQGYTHSEIVEELGIPLGTIKTRLRNAIQELRRILPHDLHIHQTC
ncbi:MAG TPA: sigma-70 family RNA polymerase sigma factor [Saprospiraceae bacterium]|nr:sigma-70 family RNA polymerase sigma factor [Saprospiraceae bacterium]